MSSTTVAARPERVTALPPGAVRRAVRDIVPIAVAVVPFGTVVGVTLDQAALVGVPALVVTGLVYAGSAQLATLAVLIAGGGPIGAVIAGAMVNARLVLYSAGHGDRFRAPGNPAWFRWLAPLLTVDQTFALAEGARDLRGVDFRRYWMTMGTVLGAGWLAAVGVGMVLGSVMPEASPMDVAIPATMVSLLAPHLRSRRLRRAALVAAVVGVASPVLPSGLGIVAAILAGLVAAGPEEVAR
jgi:4-azaleucine resistance transporter AzlC